MVANLLWEGASCSFSHENVAKPANFGSCKAQKAPGRQKTGTQSSTVFSVFVQLLNFCLWWLGLASITEFSPSSFRLTPPLSSPPISPRQPWFHEARPSNISGFLYRGTLVRCCLAVMFARRTTGNAPDIPLLDYSLSQRPSNLDSATSFVSKSVFGGDVQVLEKVSQFFGIGDKKEQISRDKPHIVALDKWRPGRFGILFFPSSAFIPVYSQGLGVFVFGDTILNVAKFQRLQIEMPPLCDTRSLYS